VGFVVHKVALGQALQEYFGFPLSISFHRFSITWEKRKKLITLITGLQNKPQGCGESVASAVGPFNLQIARQNTAH
jgi:hypothetical protein